jgi:hypothetical protein
VGDTTSAVVRFTSVYRNYIPNDIARFPLATARDLVAMRLAVPVHVTPAPPRPAKTAPPASDDGKPQPPPAPTRQPTSVVRK